MTGEKMRVYEIAKEVGIPNKDLIAKIRALGLEVNNHMSSLDADDVARIKRSLEKVKAGERPAQTQRLWTGGAVLGRRWADKPTDGDARTEDARPATPVSAAPAPVIRRRAVVEEPKVEEPPPPPPKPSVIKRT